MKCVVTGAAGYIGNVLVNHLLSEGYDVTAFVRKSDDITHITEVSNIVYGDVCDIDSLCGAFANADAVVHLAGIIDIGTANKRLMQRVNIGGTRNVITACLKNNVRKLVYVSSVHALPELASNQKMTEISDFNPSLVRGTYAKTKASATAHMLEAAANGLETIVVHPSGVIGPFDYGLSNIGQLIVDFLCGQLTAYIDGKYNFVDVRDVANGISKALEIGKRGECYILSGDIITVEQLLKTVSKVSGKKMLTTKLPFWFAYGSGFLSEIYYSILRRRPLYTAYSVKTLRSNCNFSNEKAKNELGMSFLNADKSIADMTNWICKHHLYKTDGKYKKCGYKD